MGVDLDQSLYALDSTTIDLCLSLFPWAKFRQRKAAVKMHTLAGPARQHSHVYPRYRGKVHDVNILDEIMPEAGAFYVMDRGYIDFERLFVLTLSSAFFVVRTKSNVLLQRRYSHPVDKSTGVRSDQTVILSSFESASAYPDPLRRVSYFDAGDEQATEVSDQQLYASGADHCRHLQAALADGRVQTRTHHPVGESPTEAKRLRPRSWGGAVARKQDGGALRQHARKEYAQRIRLQRTVNADVASLHESPVAETVDNARKQQELAETSPKRRLSPAGYQRRHGVKEDVATGEALGARRRNLAEEMPAITVSGKCGHRHQGDGSGRSTVDGRAAKRARREGPGPVSIPFVKVRQG